MLIPRDVTKAFSLLEKGDWVRFLEEHIAEDVQWTITGTSVLAGTYVSRQDFIDRAFSRLQQALAGDIRMVIHHIFVDQSTAIVEMTSIATSKKGHPYHNEYVWILTFHNNKAISVRVYFDDVLVNQTII